MKNMCKIVALTGATGAMGGEVLLSLMRSDKQISVRCIIYEAEKTIPKFVRKIFKKYRERIFAFKGDIARYEDCVKLLDGAEYLINCASIIPPKSDHNPQGTYLSNYIGTKNLVDAVIAGGNKVAFVHIATVALYGNRSMPHIWGRVGDPIISSDYDSYSLYKLKAERYLLESGLKKFVSLRQTGILHKYMFANNLKDGLMFHTPWNCVLEWVTDVDSGILCKNLIERDLDERLDGFWNRVYNIGGMDEYKKIPSDWKKYRLLCESEDYEKLKDKAFLNKETLLNHGYDESKPLEELNIDDLQSAAKFRGGECIAEEYEAGNLHKKIAWRCGDGHEFLSTPLHRFKGRLLVPALLGAQALALRRAGKENTLLRTALLRHARQGRGKRRLSHPRRR